jgi:hypothetical protein
MVNVQGETSSIQGKKEKCTRYVSQNEFITRVHFRLIRPSSFVLHCTPVVDLISQKCTRVINLFFKTYQVLFSFIHSIFSYLKNKTKKNIILLYFFPTNTSPDCFIKINFVRHYKLFIN